MTRLDHRRVAPGVSRLEVSRSQVGDPSSATFHPRELQPFALRYHFHRVDDDEGRRRWLLLRPEIIAPDPDDLAEWTSEHERTFAENAFVYRLYAERLVDMRLLHAGDWRAGMLEFDDEHNKDRKRPEELSDLYLLALSSFVAERLSEGYNKSEIASRFLPMSRATMYRRLDEAKRRGLAQR